MAELVWKHKSRLMFSSSSYAGSATGLPSPSSGLVTQQYYAPVHPVTTLQEDWHNRLILGDNNDVLPLLLPQLSGEVKLIYIDPPFMTGRTFKAGPQVAYRDSWPDLDHYLQWLYETLTRLYDLLAEDGSLYIHLDWRVIHYAKIMLDEIFGFNPLVHGPGLKNEIIWHYQSGGRARRTYARKHDTILFYTKSAHYSFHSERTGQRRGAQKRNHMRREVGVDGSVSWTIRSAGRIYTYHEDTLMSQADVWDDISHLHQRDPERTGYATQKPEALLERILLVSSNEQDLVLDCFCGSGVTPVVAERLGRRWIACDKSELAIALTRERLLSQNFTTSFALQRATMTDQSLCDA